MRPYRFRSLPRKRAYEPTQHTQRPTQSGLPGSSISDDATPMPDTTAIFLLASLLNPDIQQDMQRLYAYLPPQAQSAAAAAMTVKANGAQLMESARIRAALERHDVRRHEDADNRSFFDVLTKTNVARKHRMQEPIAQTADAFDHMHTMRETIPSIQSEGSHAFLSRHLQSRLQQSMGNMEPILSMLRPRQHAKARPSDAQAQSPNMPLMNMLMGNTRSNPMLSLLMQGNARSNPMLSQLMQGNARSNPMLSQLMQGDARSNPILSQLMQGDARSNPMLSQLMQGDARSNPMLSLLMQGIKGRRPGDEDPTLSPAPILGDGTVE